MEKMISEKNLEIPWAKEMLADMIGEM